MFRVIKPEEFAIFLWGDKSAKGAKQLQAYIDRFNKIGYWVGTIVCSYEQVAKRIEALEKFIKVARRYVIMFVITQRKRIPGRNELCKGVWNYKTSTLPWQFFQD